MIYPDIAFAVADAVLQDRFARAIRLCGIGMAISANKVSGMRAAQCHDTCSAERASKSNNAQIITLGARGVVKSMVDIWMTSEFSG